MARDRRHNSNYHDRPQRPYPRDYFGKDQADVPMSPRDAVQDAIEYVVEWAPLRRALAIQPPLFAADVRRVRAIRGRVEGKTDDFIRQKGPGCEKWTSQRRKPPDIETLRTVWKFCANRATPALFAQWCVEAGHIKQIEIMGKAPL